MSAQQPPSLTTRQSEPLPRIRFRGRNYGLESRWPEHMAVQVVSLSEALAAIDKIEREQYTEGGRCGDFTIALDEVRKALAS